MFNQHHVALARLWVHLRRLLVSIAIAGGLVLAALGAGIMGYHWIAKLSWIDSVHNAAMILAGMGPVDDLNTSVAKLFASAYALFSGLVFVVAMGLVLAPILHGMLHKFRLDDLDHESPVSGSITPSAGSQIITGA